MFACPAKERQPQKVNFGTPINVGPSIEPFGNQIQIILRGAAGRLKEVQENQRTIASVGMGVEHDVGLDHVPNLNGGRIQYSVRVRLEPLIEKVASIANNLDGAFDNGV
jgi:hypothetical protein